MAEFILLSLCELCVFNRGKKMHIGKIIITGLLFLLTSVAYSQSIDSTSLKEKKERKYQRMDRFIDADGDGICDQRSQGLGFRRKGNPPNMKKQTGSDAEGTQPTGKGSQHRGGKK